MNNKSNILVVGDVHGNYTYFSDLVSKLNPWSVFQAGELGIWPRIRFNKCSNQISYTNHTAVYFVDGNHDDHEWIIEKKSNSNLGYLPPNFHYMERGSVLNVPNIGNVLFIGGAESIDRSLRTQGYDWFPQESITYSQIQSIFDRHDKIDCVISHCAPEEFNIIDTKYDPHEWKVSRKMLSCVLEKYNPSRWVFGHYHIYKDSVYKNCHWTGLANVYYENVYNDSNDESTKCYTWL